MNLLVRCRCEQWVLDELSPNQTFYNLDCSICCVLHCGPSNTWANGLSNNRYCRQCVLESPSVHRRQCDLCQGRGAIVDGQYTWYVEPTGRYIREIHGLMVTEDHW